MNARRVSATAAVLAGALMSAWTCPRETQAATLTVTWTAKAVTVVSKPFGLTVPLQTDVAGYLTYDTAAKDKAAADPLEGAYQHTGNAAFFAAFLGHHVDGSTTPFYEVDLDVNPTIDTFRVYDGPRPVGNEGGVMSFDGVASDQIQLFLAITGDAFDSDALIDPFPSYTFGFLGTPHTFTLKDEQGTMLMQISSAAAAVCGDPSGGGITASDALQVLKTSVGSRSCLSCICDVDANGAIAVSDALKLLKHAVSGIPALHCSPCL